MRRQWIFAAVMALVGSATVQAFTTGTLERAWDIRAPRQAAMFLHDFSDAVAATTASAEAKLAALATAVDAVASMTVPLASESGTTPVLRTPVERVYLRLGAPARGIMRAVLMQWVRAHFVAQREKASAEQALWTRDEDTMMGGLKD